MHALRPHQAPVALRRQLAEDLLEGDIPTEAVPVAFAPIARLVSLAAGPCQPHEIADERSVLATVCGDLVASEAMRFRLAGALIALRATSPASVELTRTGGTRRSGRHEA